MQVHISPPGVSQYIYSVNTSRDNERMKNTVKPMRAGKWRAEMWLKSSNTPPTSRVGLLPISGLKIEGKINENVEE